MKINQLMSEVLDKILSQGVEVNLSKDKEGELLFDLNVQAKSGLKIKSNEDNTITCYGRYNHVATVESYEELLWEVKGCLHGRDFMSGNWVKILEEENILTVTTNVTTTFS